MIFEVHFIDEFIVNLQKKNRLLNKFYNSINVNDQMLFYFKFFQYISDCYLSVNLTIFRTNNYVRTGKFCVNFTYVNFCFISKINKQKQISKNYNKNKPRQFSTGSRKMNPAMNVPQGIIQQQSPQQNIPPQMQPMVPPQMVRLKSF